MIHVYSAHSPDTHTFEAAGHDRLAAIEDVAAAFFEATENVVQAIELGKALARLPTGTVCQWKDYELSYSTQES